MPKTAKLKPVIEEISNPPGPFARFRSIKSRPYSFFLDSACASERLGRYSFLGCDPFLVFRAKGDSVELEWESGRREELKANPFLELRKLLNEYPAAAGPEGIPFTGGAVGYFSYDLKDLIEKLPNTAKDDLGLPDCLVGFYDSVAIYDNLTGRSFISSLGISDKPSVLRDRIRKAAPAGRVSCGGLESNFSKSSYAAAVNAAKEYIRKGDIYQVNISQRFKARLSGDPLDLYARLRQYSPAPFASFLNFNDTAILSSSPERFLLKSGSYIETRPIKGTRPRGGTSARDEALEAELKNSAKDMAEHIMIVDLERNDLGRICEYGSVRPTETAVVEKYANVFHLVSTVAGELKYGVDAIDCLVAAFPGGSITGAPKIRSMEIIDELEGVRRSAYTGTIGYIGFDGNMDTSIVIRTFIVKGKDIYLQVGGGIVADSDPDEEYEETLDKAAGAMQALGKNRDSDLFSCGLTTRK
ncbi:MAG: aminodeoxychorismate synthase component I [Candidatus Omnitrophota bacterium]